MVAAIATPGAIAVASTVTRAPSAALRRALLMTAAPVVL
jgi:hypothetical protein